MLVTLVGLCNPSFMVCKYTVQGSDLVSTEKTEDLSLVHHEQRNGNEGKGFVRCILIVSAHRFSVIHWWSKRSDVRSPASSLNEGSRSSEI